MGTTIEMTSTIEMTFLDHNSLGANKEYQTSTLQSQRKTIDWPQKRKMMVKRFPDHSFLKIRVKVLNLRN